MTPGNPQPAPGPDLTLAAMSDDDALRTAMPPLTVLPDRPRDWGEECDLCRCLIEPDTVTRIEDRIRRRYCHRCAQATDPDAASAAAILENTWQALLGAAGGTHFTDTAAVLRLMADTIDRIASCELDVHHLLTTAGGEPRTHCTARPEQWIPPWTNWPNTETS